ncbi:hypothetical protein BDV96DRAFT_564466 [Lophiotrema nucula]|uniref:Uncharacterized protein n=1 Tax=Lophiotrema nucula TaxID=690887 RepID=A0A6A5ZPC6_9PLEO|nr:hypothetical protein BDV96DRAFT_564466 [Lophiotrema nucula]
MHFFFSSHAHPPLSCVSSPAFLFDQRALEQFEEFRSFGVQELTTPLRVLAFVGGKQSTLISLALYLSVTMPRGGYDMSIDRNGVVPKKIEKDAVEAAQKEANDAIIKANKEKKAEVRREAAARREAKKSKEGEKATGASKQMNPPTKTTRPAAAPAPTPAASSSSSSRPRASDYGRTWGKLPERQYRAIAPAPPKDGQDPSGNGA